MESFSNTRKVDIALRIIFVLNVSIIFTTNAPYTAGNLHNSFTLKLLSTDIVPMTTLGG